MVRRPAGTRTCVVVLAAVAVAAVLLLAGLGSGLLFVAPALLTIAALTAGWFPGEDALVSAIARRRPRLRRAPLRVVPRRAARVIGSTLHPVAGCCAGRAPPLPA